MEDDSQFSPQSGKPHFEQKYFLSPAPSDGGDLSGLRHSRQMVLDLQFGPQTAAGSSKIVSVAEMGLEATMMLPTSGLRSIRKGQHTSEM